MERKYYLRGLGLGIVVTVVIMGVALSGNKAMTNDEIIARAKELGLVENTVLSDTENEDAVQENTDTAQQNTDENLTDDRDAAGQSLDVDKTGQEDLAAAGSDIDSDTEADGDTADETDQENDPDADETESEDENKDDAEEMQDDVTNLTPDDTEVGNVDEVVTPATIKVITINSGDSSYTVAKKLENAGVVTSAATFDTFLCQNGYDKRLRTGSFSISTDASDEQIARIVTGME